MVILIHCVMLIVPITFTCRELRVVLIVDGNKCDGWKLWSFLLFDFVFLNREVLAD